MSSILPDVLATDLRIVFCGTAAGNESARQSAYYAHPGNKFWRTLFAIGLTPRQLPPAAFNELLQYGIGLTDLAKYVFGNDSQLKAGDFDPSGLRRKITQFQPRAWAFTSKTAGMIFYGSTHIHF